MAENLKGAVLVPREILEAATAEARARFPEYATNPDHGRAANGYLQGFLECYRRERLAAVSLTEREAGEDGAVMPDDYSLGYDAELVGLAMDELRKTEPGLALAVQGLKEQFELVLGGAASPTRKGSSEMTAEECLHEVRERLLNHSAAEEAHLIAVDLPELISLVIGPLPQPPSGPVVMHTGGPDLTDLPF